MTTPVRTIDVLRAARKRIEDPKRWTRMAFARTSDGTGVTSDCDAAAKWCLVGSLWKERRNFGLSADDTDPLMRALCVLAARLGDYRTLVDANDSGGHAVALRILDAAIAELEGQ